MSLRKAARKFTKTIDSTAIADASVDNFGINGTLSGLTEGELYDVTLDRADSNGSLTPAKEEVLTCEVSGDRFINCVRGVEGTAQAHSAGALLEIRLTASMWNDLIEASNDLPLSIANILNPIGTIREFTVSTNPATLLGFGTWAAFGTGRVTVGIDAEQTEFDTAEETGGEKTHLLTGAESGLPAHTHTLFTLATAGGANNRPMSSAYSSLYANTTYNDTSIKSNDPSNASSAHNNLQPYIVVYRWKRTA